MLSIDLMNQNRVAVRTDLRRLSAMAIVTIGVSVLPTIALAQQQQVKAPTSVNLTTKDGVDLHCEFYECKEPSSGTVPVILVHGYDGHSGEWAAVAKKLQDAGHSVIVPDLRGHGKSTSRTAAGGQAGKALRPERLRAADLEKMITMDMESVKKFLMKKHNNEELNIDMLTLIGSEFGSIVAALWTAQDWSWPLVGGQKQGQDVKAIALLSPLPSYKGLTLAPAIKSPAFGEIAAFVVYGKSGKRGSDAKRLFKTIERAQQANREPRAFEWAIDTKLQGMKLLQERKSQIAQAFEKFIGVQIVARADEFPYKKRESP